VHLGVKNVVLDDFFNSNKSCQKGEQAEIKDMRLFFCYSLGKSWQEVLHICGEFIPKVLHGAALVNNNERDAIVNGESSFFYMLWNFASKKPSAVIRKQACISLLHSADKRHPLLTKRWRESFSISSMFFNFMMFLGGETTRTTTSAPFAFLLPLRRVDISDFPQSRSAKLQQRLSAEED